MQFLRNFEINLAHSVDEWIGIARARRCEPTEEEVWERLVQYSEPPLLANVYMSVLLNCIRDSLLEEYPSLNIDSYINSLDTHFYVNGQEIHSKAQLDELLSDLTETEDFGLQ